MKPYGALGIDQLPNVLYRRTMKIILPYLQLIYNTSLQLSMVPSQLHATLFILVIKQFTHNQRLQWMRPISLLPHISKGLKVIMIKRIKH